MDDNPYTSPQTAVTSVATPPIGKLPARLGAVSLLLALISSVWLLIAAAHVQSDRTNRIPVVTFEGPFAGYVDIIVLSALVLSLIAGILANVAMQETRRPFALAIFALLVSVANFIITVIITSAIYED